MDTKEYIVCLKKDVDLHAFWAEIESSGNISPQVPARPVQIANNRDFTPRQCHYYLTDQEVLLLRQDSRVAGVNVPVEQNPLVRIEHSHINQSRNNFQKTTSSVGSFVNWGLVRNSALSNVYGTAVSSQIGYGYFLDGTGVDIVIIDSGIQADHPEFQKVNEAISRVQEINWFERAGLNPALQPAGFYSDYDGHGTHVAGIAAGKTYGWAKNANIFSIKLNGLQGPTDPGTGLTWDQAVEVLLGWHQNKMNPASVWYTGRPTVINMSFAYLAPNIVNFYTVIGGTYRLNNWTGGGWYQPNYGMIFDTYALPVRYTTTDDDVDTLIENGMTVCIAANNFGLKIDRPTGPDYNNKIITAQSSIYNDYGNWWYYMQGSSPYSLDAFIVGNMDSTVRTDGQDQKSISSSAGPGVNIFAAGSNVMSACSNVVNVPRYGNPGPYWWDQENFKQINLRGTSMASPQIAGIAACRLQQDLGASPAQIKARILDTATYTIYNSFSFSSNDYTNRRSQWGGNAPVAYSTTQGAVIKNNFTWNPLANVSIKTDETTWTPVEKIWIKTSSNTWTQVY